MSADDRTEELRQRKREARQSGGPERVAARRRKGVGSARERVLAVLDADTFVELDVFTAGAVTGHGKVGNRDVYVFSLDGETSPSALDQACVRKIVKVVGLGMKNGAPLVGIYDCGGILADAERGTASSEKAPQSGCRSSYSDLFFRTVMASGLVPQISIVVGACIGSAVYAPLLSDFVVMAKGGGQLFLGDAAVLKSGAEGEVGLEEVGGARSLSECGGVAHLAADEESGCFDIVRRLLSYLPQNNLEDTPLLDSPDPVDRMDEELESLALGEAAPAEDARQIIGHLVDEGAFLEIMPLWGQKLVVGFARLGGRAVGVVANQPTIQDGRLDPDALIKGARFVRFCDAFNLPLITLVDTPGFVVGGKEGHARVMREAAKLIYAYCEATVPKLAIVTHQARAEGFEIMCSKQIGADFNFAWPAAVIGVPSSARNSKSENSKSPYEAAADGLLDDIIEPATTRPRLVAALEACVSKREERPPKKHGNIPL
jgi:acetyl-CoA carboxylase carboxyltransferase component